MQMIDVCKIKNFALNKNGLLASVFRAQHHAVSTWALLDLTETSACLQGARCLQSFASPENLDSVTAAIRAPTELSVRLGFNDRFGCPGRAMRVSIMIGGLVYHSPKQAPSVGTPRQNNM